MPQVTINCIQYVKISFISEIKLSLVTAFLDFQVKAFDRTTFVSTSFDNTMKIWNSEDLKDACILKGERGRSYVLYILIKHKDWWI
jgi:hypothetical protein